MSYINGLHFNNIRGDIYGGLTAAVVALPLAMAMGVASGVGPIAGMYGAIFVGLFAALFSGTPAQVSGPTGPMTAVLAGILIKVGTEIIDWDYLKRLKNAPRAGIVIMFTVLVVTVTIDLLLAVGIGMIMASFLFMQRMTDMQIANTSAITNPEDIGEEMALTEQETEIMTKADNQIMLFHMKGPMSFSSAKAIIRRHAEIMDYCVMVLDLSDVSNIDFTTSRALEDIITDTIAADRHMILVGGNKQVSTMLLQQGVLVHIDESNMHSLRIDALRQAQDIIN